MQLSLPGLLVCLGLLVLGALLRAPLLGALFTSLAFGSTAIVIITAMGNTSPLIYTVFAASLLLAAAFHRDMALELGTVFSRRYWPSWLVLLLSIHVVVGAVLFPRLFAGETITFTTTRLGISETMLAPGTANFTQPAYFVLGALTYAALATHLLGAGRLAQVRRALLAMIIVHIGLGMLDLAGKLASAGDVLLPIRTATFTMLTEIAEAGFWRIVGGYSEASAYGAATLTHLAFAYTYWKRSGSQLALALAIVLLILLLLSTSSGAYVGFAVLCLPVAGALVFNAARNRFRVADALLILSAVLFCGLLLALVTFDAAILKPFVDLFDKMVLGKVDSSSAKERFYWNAVSMQSFFDTYGFGIGMGSSRSSSWIISMISQLGVIGALLYAGLFFVLLRAVARPAGTRRAAEGEALGAAAAAGALAGIVAGCIAGASADPGLLFFAFLAIVVTTQAQATERASRLRLAAGMRRRTTYGQATGSAQPA